MSPDKPLLAAAAEVDITPPIGVFLEGYFERQEPSRGVHDPLMAQALLLRRGSSAAVLISLDLIGIRLGTTARVRAVVAQACGVDEAAVMLACSHTHAGPAGFLAGLPLIHSPIDPQVVQMVERKVASAAAECRHALRPARMGIGRGRVRGLGANRNNPEADLDDEVIVLRVEDSDGNPLALWMNYGCHPTVMGHENLLISADYPGAARRALRRIYPDCISLYTNGASGDISTRYTRRAQTFDEVERMGRLLAGEVIVAMETAIPLDSPEIEGRAEPIEFPFRSMPEEGDVRSEIGRLQQELEALSKAGASHGEIRRAETRLEGATGLLTLLGELKGIDRFESQLQLLVVGPLALVGIPGEPFTSTVLDIKRRSGRPYTAVVSYCNDEAGYFPDRPAFAAGTYEALLCPLREDVAESLAEQALTMLSGR